MKKAVVLALTFALSLFLMSACSGPTDSTAAATALYTPGTYTGTGAGKGGDVLVDVEFSENEILSVTINEDNAETPEIASVAYKELPADIIEAQSADVDTISGATFTSKGILEAVSNSIEQAKQ